MFVEGKGWVEPSPVRVLIRRVDLDRLRQIAAEREQYRAYSRRPDRWGKGLTRGSNLIGLVGEHAFCRWSNSNLGTHLCVDTLPRPRGDGGVDFVLPGGVALQLKTCGDRGQNLVRSFDNYIRPIRARVYGFAEWRQEEMATYLRGWIDADRLTDPDRGGVFEKSPVPSLRHFNLNVPSSHLEKMGRLVLRCRWERAA